MQSQQTPPPAPQLVAMPSPNCSKTPTELSARDYSALFHSQVINRFVSVQSIKQTARDFSIPARVVSEILHLSNFRRQSAQRVA